MSRFELHPFDLLFRDMFKTEQDFQSPFNTKVNHPVDIRETDEGLVIEIACVGAERDEIELLAQGDTVRVAYRKDNRQDEDYIQRGIAKRNFDLGWRLASKFDVEKTTASLNKGLLAIEVPYKKEEKPFKVTIK